MRRIPTAVAVGAAVGTLGVGGLAYASTAGSGTPANTKASKPRIVRRAALLRRAIYAQVIVEGKGHVAHTITFERGRFTGISAGDLHLSRLDGVQVSAPITAATTFHKIPEASLVAGDRVRIVERDGITTSVTGRAAKGVSTPFTGSS